MLRNTLTKENILRSDRITSAFSQILHRIYTPHFRFLVASRDDNDSTPGVVICAARKKVKLAVKRNLCRRIVKESFRKNKALFTSMSVIAITTKLASSADKGELWQSVERFIKQYKLP